VTHPRFVYPNFIFQVNVGSKSQNSMTNVGSERMIAKMTDGAKNLGDKGISTYTVN